MIDEFKSIVWIIVGIVKVWEFKIIFGYCKSFGLKGKIELICVFVFF